MKEMIDYIKSKLSKVWILPTSVEIVIEDKPNVLEGKTTIQKHKGDITARATITIFLSRNLVRRKNIRQAIKLVLIHEYCHVVNPINPDFVMQMYFPKEYKIWKKAQDARSLDCSVEFRKP